MIESSLTNITENQVKEEDEGSPSILGSFDSREFSLVVNEVIAECCGHNLYN